MTAIQRKLCMFFAAPADAASVRKNALEGGAFEAAAAVEVHRIVVRFGGQDGEETKRVLDHEPANVLSAAICMSGDAENFAIADDEDAGKLILAERAQTADGRVGQIFVDAREIFFGGGLVHACGVDFVSRMGAQFGADFADDGNQSFP